MTEFKFVDEVPAAHPGRNRLYVEFAEALRENTGKWAVWPREFKNKTSANATVSNLRRGLLVNFPKSEFEARSSDGVVYIRHTGGVA